jgi:FkbM family methyltransferase
MNEFWDAVATNEVDPKVWPIERLLKQPEQEIVAGLTAAYGDAIRSARNIYIYGAGTNGRWLAQLLGRRKLAMTGFIDDTPALQGTMVCGAPVFSSHGLDQEGPDTVVVVSIFLPTHSFFKFRDRLAHHACKIFSLHQALISLGADALPYCFIESPQHLLRSRAAIIRLSCRLVGEGALHRLWRHLMFCLTMNHQYSLEPYTDRFSDKVGSSEETVFVDGGAFDGDTLRAFLKCYGTTFKRAYAFEPDVNNFKRLIDYAGSLSSEVRRRVSLHNLGLWSGSATLNYESTGTAASLLSPTGSETVRVAALDDICDVAGKYLVKLDIEGAEAEALRGMARIVRQMRPYIEIAVYLKPADLYELAELLFDLDKHYRFDLRAYGYDGADTMLCAIPEHQP